MLICCVNIICVFLFVSTSHFDSMYCKNVCMYRSCYAFSCGWVYFWINSWNSYNSCIPVLADKFTQRPTSLTNEVKLSAAISHITHQNACSALYRIWQYVYFSMLSIEGIAISLLPIKSGFLNYLLPGGVVMVDRGFTTYDLSCHRHVILYIHAFIKIINFNLLLRCSNN